MSEPTSDAFAVPFIQYECSDRIATITFNRPEKLNAFNDAMVMRLAAVLHEFDIDEAADVAVLRGNGRAFCSGADVHQRQLRSDEDLKKHGGSQGWGAHAADLFTRAINWKPVIAAPHGFAVGLGLGMVLESEMVVAEAGTRFQVTETSRGLASSRYWALLNFRGAGNFATEAALTGRFFTAEEALAAGVIDRVAPRASTWRRPMRWRSRSPPTRRSACARRCAPGAGTWTRPSARPTCRPCR